ncbi:MAG TPA: oligosaccharide flippase family protein [Chloroflexia bacterium]|nr:oligosaccharide flippase family protein [Chloroflexia bacterium]
MPRSRLLTNAASNYAGQLTVVATGILLTPFIVAHLGSSMYGVWALIISIQGLGGLLDFGVTTSVVKYVAEHHARDETDEINRVVSSSFFLHLLIGLLTFAVLCLGAWVGLPLLNLDGRQLDIARQALVVAAAGLMLALPLGVPGNLLTGLRRYEISNAINIAQTLISAALIILVLSSGGGPVELVTINAVGLAAAYAAKWFFAGRALSGLRISLRFSNLATLKRIGSYSIWLFVLDTAGKIFYNADAVLIAAFLPVSKVTDYNLGFRPASAVSYLSGPMVSVFLPAASEMEARRQTGHLQRLLLTGTRVAFALTLVAALWLLAFGRQVMEVWVGPGHEEALPVLYIFLAVFLVSAAQNPAGAILKGMGRVRALSISVLLEYAANIAISLLLIPRIGIAGAAVGTLVPALVNDLFVIPWLVCRALGLGYGRFIASTLAGPVLAAVPTLLLLWPLSVWLRSASLVTISAGAIAAVILFVLFYLVVGAGKEEKALLADRLAPLRSRLRPGKLPYEPYEAAAQHIDTNPEQAPPARPDSGQP